VTLRRLPAFIIDYRLAGFNGLLREMGQGSRPFGLKLPGGGVPIRTWGFLEEKNKAAAERSPQPPGSQGSVAL